MSMNVTMSDTFVQANLSLTDTLTLTGNFGRISIKIMQVLGHACSKSESLNGSKIRYSFPVLRSTLQTLHFSKS